MGRYLLILIFILSAIGHLHSQEEPLYFDHLTKDDGLSSNRVNCIFEDSEGFIWFGTEDGLSKYDGYTFEVFRNIPDDSTSIIDNSIISIIEDTTSNNLIVATNMGLTLFSRALYSFRLIFAKELEIAPGRNFDINAMCFDKDGNLLVGTWRGLYQFDLKEEILLNHFSASDSAGGIRSDIIRTILKGRDERIWIGHQEGIDILDLSTKSIQEFHPEIKIREIRALYEDQDRGIWIGSDISGLYYFPEPYSSIHKHFSQETGEFTGNRVHGIIERQGKSFLVIVRDDGLYNYDLANDNLTCYTPDIYESHSINSKAVISGYRSSQGIVWFGTYNSGINYIDNRRKNFEHYRINFKETGLFNNNVRALCEDSEGYIWIGTKEGGGLSRFDRRTKQFKNYRKTEAPGGLTDDYIFSICELDPDRLLIGTIREGLAVFNKRSEKFTYFKNNPDNPFSLSNNRIYDVYKDSEGQIWVGNFRDLQNFDPLTGNFFTVEGIEIPKVIIEEGNDHLWIGTRNNGLFLYEKAGKTFKQYRYDPEEMNSIPNNDLYALARDNFNGIWIGTKRGLCRLDLETDSVTRYFESDGLASNWICGIEIDDKDNIWISTINGLSKFDIRTGTFHNYDVKDGLQGNEFEGFVSLKTSDGHILFGGRNGFNMFLPEEIIDNTSEPRIVITKFNLYNKDVPIGQPGSPLEKHISLTNNLKLKYNQSAFTFNYTALNYTSPEKNQYAYILHGFDEDWIQAGTNRSAVYTNIPPGSYKFQVIGSNNDGYWNSVGVSLDIEITPPPWKTDLAYFIYVIILSGILFLVRRMLILRIEQKQEIEFERKDKERIQELNQMKLRFFTNISHEFRTPLTLISGPLDKLMSYKDENDERRYLLNMMRNNVKRLLLLINELMDFRKADQGKLKLHVAKHDPVKFIHEIIYCFEEYALSKNISIYFNHDLQGITEFWFDKAVIDKVIFNLLSNAVKYNHSGGRVTIELHPEGGNLNISVSDTGKGISKADLEGIFERFYRVEDKQQLHLSGSGIGLAFSKRLLEAHRGEIEVESMVNIGSKFTIHFPVSIAAYNDDEIVDSKVIIEPESAEFPSLNEILPADETLTEEDILSRDKVLIVEDNEELRNYLANNFKSYMVLLAENGNEGYKLALKEMPDIVISDIMMPEMDGIELCNKLKTQLATSHIPIILLSAKTDVDHKIEGIETGADSYIEKPFEMDYLNAVVKNLLKQRESLRKRFSIEPEVDLGELDLTSHEKRFIEKSRSIIERNIQNPDFSVETMGMELGLSRSQLFRKFRSLYDLKPSELIRTERLKKAKALLATREYNISEVAYQSGFKSSSYFITSFKKYFGETPNEYFNRLKSN